MAFDSVRVELTWMVLGHSAGTAAALVAAGRASSFHTLSHSLLQQALLAEKQKLSFSL